jgi:hypothetical protein
MTWSSLWPLKSALVFFLSQAFIALHSFVCVRVCVCVCVCVLQGICSGIQGNTLPLKPLPQPFCFHFDSETGSLYLFAHAGLEFLILLPLPPK